MSSEYLSWLEKSGLKETVQKSSRYFLPVLTDCLAVKDEEIVIISDYGSDGQQIAPIMAGCYYFAAQQKNFKTQLIMQTPKKKGEDAHSFVVKALEELPPQQVVLICLSNTLGSLGVLGKSYRLFCKNKKHKFASTAGLGCLKNGFFPDLLRAINIDYLNLRKNGLRIKKILENSKEIKVLTKTGTDLSMDISGVKAIANVGFYNQPGLGGNLPMGEVYLPPRMGKVEGRLVIDGSMRYSGGTLVAGKPMCLTIEKGRVTEIKGPGAELVEKTLADAEKMAEHPERIRLIGEFGIGINPGARIIGATILDEKALGTAHIAIGSNYWFGGEIKTIIHLDQVFRNPEIFVDGERLKV